jgi:hypothetical protein
VLTPRTAHVASGVFTDDADLTLTGYLGVDDNNLYVSIKVIDDVYCYSSTASYYKNDVVFLYLGLYDQVRKHMSTERGEEPDYRFICYLTIYATSMQELVQTRYIQMAMRNTVSEFWRRLLYHRSKTRLMIFTGITGN